MGDQPPEEQPYDAEGKFNDAEYEIVEGQGKYDVAWAFAFMNGLPEPSVLRGQDVQE